MSNQLVEYKWEQEELFVDTWQRYMPCTGQLIQGKFLALICKLSIRYVPSFNFFFQVCLQYVLHMETYVNITYLEVRAGQLQNIKYVFIAQIPLLSVTT